MPSPSANDDTFAGVAAEVASALRMQLLASAGGGAFKRVYHAKTGTRSVALKIVTRPGVSLRTAREIDAIEKCDHPGICRLYRSGSCPTSQGELSYIVEEFLPGGSLEDRITAGGTTGEAETLSIAQVLAGALVHLRARDLVHRDIKPANIMFRDGGWLAPVLVDFGIVRDLSAISLTQSWLARGPGTPYFAAPEQLNNQKPLIDWRADQFSCAVTLAVARYGAHPYKSDGEPLYSGTTVERVANRQGPAKWFTDTAIAGQLAALVRSVQPWPFQRFCRPAEYLQAWFVK